MMGRNRFLSSDSVTLEEAITAYEKLKKGRDFPKFLRIVSETDTQDDNSSETSPMVMYGDEHKFDHHIEHGKFSNGLLKNFNVYRDFNNSKYSYYSAEVDLLQGNTMHSLSPEVMKLLASKHFWLNITDPDEDDIDFLRETFEVNEIVLSEIQEGNVEERVETFRQHMFISLRLLGEQHFDASAAATNPAAKSSSDMAFNMILFKDFIITTHSNPWDSIPNILSFLFMICKSGKEEMKPEWVLFSILVELTQDGKFLLDLMEPEIDNIRIGSKSLAEMSNVMRRNFDMEFHIYKIHAFITPKVNVLRQLLSSSTHSNRLTDKMKKHLKDAQNDFIDLLDHLKNFNHIVERSQDTILALANVEHARLANGLSIAMNRIGEIALVFLPIQALAGFFGMNVKVPFQEYESTIAFWCIALFSCLLAIAMYVRSRSLSVKSEVTPLPVKLRGDILYENGVPGDKSFNQKSSKNSSVWRKGSQRPLLRKLNSNPIYNRVASLYSKTSSATGGDNEENV